MHRARDAAACAVRLDVVERREHRDLVLRRAAELALPDEINDELADFRRVAPDLHGRLMRFAIPGYGHERVLPSVGDRFDGMHIQHDAVFAHAHEQRHIGHLTQVMQDGFVLEQQTL